MSHRTKSFVQVACWLTHDQRDRLTALQKRVPISKQEFLRRAVEKQLRRYERGDKET